MILRTLTIIAVFMLALSCASRPFEHYTIDSEVFTDRAIVKESDSIRVRVAVPSAEETSRVFGVPLYQRGIQPVWIEVANTGPDRIRFAPAGTDPDYFSPLEVAYGSRKGFSKSARRDMERYFRDIAMPRRIPARTTRSGFVFTHLRSGTKDVTVDLYGNRTDARFTFFVEVPGLEPDHADIDLDQIYSPDDLVDLDGEGLLEYLREFDCCARNVSGEPLGYPVNVVLIGSGAKVLGALLRAGWNETLRPRDDADRERQAKGQYLFGRTPDAVFRRQRGDQDRNEMRLWLAPRTLGGTRIWMAQSAHYMAHRNRVLLDPDVDDTRAHTVQSLWYAQAVEQYGMVRGPESFTIDEGREGIDGMFFTDGFRGVIWLSGEPVSMLEVRHIELDEPPVAR